MDRIGEILTGKSGETAETEGTGETSETEGTGETGETGPNMGRNKRNRRN